MSDQLDALILSAANSRWQKVARIIGSVEGELENIKQAVDSEGIADRVQVLVATGRLESKGNLSRPRHSEVRLPDTFTARA